MARDLFSMCVVMMTMMLLTFWGLAARQQTHKEFAWTLMDQMNRLEAVQYSYS